MDEETLEEFVKRLKDRNDKFWFPAFEYSVAKNDMNRLIALAELKLWDTTHCSIDELEGNGSHEYYKNERFSRKVLDIP